MAVCSEKTTSPLQFVFNYPERALSFLPGSAPAENSGPRSELKLRLLLSLEDCMFRLQLRNHNSLPRCTRPKNEDQEEKSTSHFADAVSFTAHSCPLLFCWSIDLIESGTILDVTFSCDCGRLSHIRFEHVGTRMTIVSAALRIYRLRIVLLPRGVQTSEDSAPGLEKRCFWQA